MEGISCNGKTYASPNEAIVDLYVTGASVNKIAHLLSCSETTVYSRLKEAGIPRRPGSGKGQWKRDMGRFFKGRR